MLFYTQQQKKRENLFVLNLLKIKYVEFKKCMLHVKLTVFYTVRFTCNRHFLNSIYVIFNQFKSNKFSRFFCCWVYNMGLQARLKCKVSVDRMKRMCFIHFNACMFDEKSQYLATDKEYS